MTEQISVWRWTGNEDLSGILERFFDAPETKGETSDMAKAVEAKYRAMDLPADILATLLDGLRSMVEEEAEDGDAPLDPAGAVTMSLASSHMLDQEPHVGLEQTQIDAEVTAQMGIYLEVLCEMLGGPGQKWLDYLDVSAARLSDEDAMVLMTQHGFEDIIHVWGYGAQVVYLRKSEGLPVIDIEVGRAPATVFEAFKALL